MGMVMVLHRLAPPEIAQVVEDPSTISDMILGPEDEEIASEDFCLGPPATAQQLDLDKSWHVIHFLLTGTAYEGEPPANTLLSGEDVGEEEVGYMVPMLLTPPQVAAFAQHLDALDNATLLARWESNGPVAEDIYMAAPREDEGMVEYVFENVDNLRIFTRASAERGEGLLVAVT